ncbi:UPF0149 family protein [Flocculibacter collagenilyticus]|uniref:UPF0149 family protein n=1 Tax=Flocculibacter collagenilyticus TaxID=2744479 RepID=UPI0018F77A42|nr:UPF0149 family protein [Flocculibacter collagenilyticus]
MSDDIYINIKNLQSLFDQFDIYATPYEVHGIVTGMVSGEVEETEQDDVLTLLSDLINDGQNFAKALKQPLYSMYLETKDGLSDTDLQFMPLLPDDDEPLSDRIESLIGWIQGFLVGFGVRKTDLKDASDDVQEALNDFAEITRMDTDMSEEEEAEEAYFEIVEYVRVSALLCFTEFHQQMKSIKAKKPTLH